MKLNLQKWGLLIGITAFSHVAFAQTTERQTAFDNYHRYTEEAKKVADRKKGRPSFPTGIIWRNMATEKRKVC